MAQVLTDSAICVCPHQGQLNFSVSQQSANGNDGKLLTLTDYKSAPIVGCTNPPPAGGPCTSVTMAQDPIGMGMKVEGDTVATDSVISLTDKGLPITVQSPGNSFVGVNVPMSSPAAKRSAFMADALAEQENEDPLKRIICAYWGATFARRDEDVELFARVQGIEDGIEATFKIWEYDLDGKHDPVEELTATIEKGEVKATWSYKYEEDVDDIPTYEDEQKGYCPPEYFLS